MRRLLGLILFCCSVGIAQDSTCDSGDVAWVADSVNADTGHTLGAATARYNDSGLPFGIQAVFDEACTGLQIRIAVGTEDNYGATSASWTGRDDTTKQININTAAGGEGTPITVTGYSALGGVPAEATLDFEKATITGASGFVFATNADRYVVDRIRITQADDDCFENNGNFNVFIRVRGDNCGGLGMDQNDASSTVVAYSQFHDNTSVGVGAAGGWVIMSESYNNASHGIGLHAGAVGIANLSYGNLNGIEVIDNSLAIFNTSRDNTNDGMTTCCNASEYSSVVNNIITGHDGAGDIGLVSDSGSVYLLVSGNNYGDNATARSFVQNPHMDEDSTPDTTTCTFVSATDHEVTANCTFSYTFPRGTTGPTTFEKGAVQTQPAGGGGTTIITQGVTF